MVYAAALNWYLNAGWPGVLPVPHEKKFPPPTGYTGDDGAWPDLLTYGRWAAEYAGYDIALRMPENVIGIDVDHYLKNGELKEGAEQLDLIVSRCGALPPTWASTARGNPDGTAGPSRTLFYRVRPGARFPGNAAADIDILQRHHRYAVVAPSVHTTAGTRYQWYRPDGSAAGEGEVPPAGELPALPKPWADYLAHPDPSLAGRRTGTGYRGSHGVRGHDDALSALAFNYLLSGRDEAEVYELWLEAAAEHTADPSWPYAEHDFARHMRGAREKVAAAHADWTDEQEFFARMAGCRTPGEIAAWTEKLNEEARTGEFTRGAVLVDENTDTVLGEAPAALAKPGPKFYVASRLPVNEYGQRVFDPKGMSDQQLAEQVLNAFHPAVRYTEDTGGWLERRSDKWIVRGKGTPAWMVAAAVDWMPWGEKSSLKPEDMTPFEAEQDARYKRRLLFTNAGKSGAVASKIATVVLSSHPSGCRMDELDTEAEVLWAGGTPWDLRASGTQPVRSCLPDDAPHMRTAGYAPGDPGAATPLWDAVTGAIWPEQELRHWALRVLAITLTGHSTADIPLLVGGAGRGKSAVSELLLDLLGEYGHKPPREILDPQHQDPYAEYELKGRRLALIDEAPQPGRNRQAKLKDLTGGTRRQGRQLYKDFVQFTPTHTLVMTANRGEDDPILSDEAIKRRVRLIPCEGDKAAVDAAMDQISYAPFTAAWRAEAPHVLAKMMRGAAAYLADPRWHLRNVPTASSLLESAIKHDQNTVLQWVLAETEHWEPGTEATDLHGAYSQWCKNHNEFAEKLNGKFGIFLREALGCAPKMNAAGRNTYPVRVRAPGIPSAREFMGAPDYGRPVDKSPETSLAQIGGIDPSTEVSVRTSPAETAFHQRPRDPLSIKEEEEEEEEEYRNIEKFHLESLGLGQVSGPADPVAADKLPSPETGENDETRKKANTPPKAKSPRTKLTPEERAERDAAKKAQLARERADAKTAKVAELGGPLVQLPAVVLRDGRVIEVTPMLAHQWLEPAVAELSLDVEHSGYPRSHADYRLRLVQLGNEHSAVVFDPGDPAQAEVIRWALADAKVLHAHSALADLIPLEAAGLGDRSMWDRMQDTVLAAKLADPSLCDSDEVGLKALAKALLGPDYALSWKYDALRSAIFAAGGWIGECEVTTPVQRSGWANIPVCEGFVRYAAADVLDCSAVARVLGRE